MMLIPFCLTSPIVNVHLPPSLPPSPLDEDDDEVVDDDGDDDDDCSC